MIQALTTTSSSNDSKIFILFNKFDLHVKIIVQNCIQNYYPNMQKCLSKQRKNESTQKRFVFWQQAQNTINKNWLTNASSCGNTKLVPISSIVVTFFSHSNYWPPLQWLLQSVLQESIARERSSQDNCLLISKQRDLIIGCCLKEYITR